jgi:hypothetical protein
VAAWYVGLVLCDVALRMGFGFGLLCVHVSGCLGFGAPAEVLDS